MRSVTAFVLLLVLLLSSSWAHAQDRADRLAELMAYVPASLLRPEPGLGVYFHDIGAARIAVSRTPTAMLDAALSDRMLMSAFLRFATMPGDMAGSVALGVGGEWQSRVGFGPDRIAAMLTVEDLPTQLTLLQMRDSADLTAAKRALLALGYESLQMGEWTAVWQGEDFAMDLSQRDSANPFGGRLGRSARIATDESVLAYSPSWAPIEAVVDGPNPSLSDLPTIAGLLDALNDPRFGDAFVVQATVLPVPWPSFDPSGDTRLDGVPAQDPTVGLPPWQIGMLADLSTGAVDYAIAAIVYSDRATAESVAEPLLTSWRDQRSHDADATFAELTGGTAETYIVGDGPSVLVLVIERSMVDDEDTQRNLAYHALMNAYFRGDLSILGVN